MKDKDFENLKRGIAELGDFLHGREVKGIRITEIAAPDVKAVRAAAQVTQAEFARLIGVNLRTLQNWEQKRSQPKGAARALLKIVQANPAASMAALHG